MSDETLKNETAVENVILEPTTVEAPAEETKPEEAKVEEAKVEDVVESVNVIEAPKPKVVAGLAPVENGAIGSTKVVKSAPVAKEEPVKPAAEKVAIYSEKNVTWNGVGKVYRGINLVSKDAADKWLERSHVRTATPEEVAKEYGL